MQGYSYSVFSLAAIVIHLIINFKLLLGRGHATTRTRRYRGFLLGTLAYYIFDGLWGVFAGLGWTAFLYVDTIFFFLSLVAFFFMWDRFVIAYLDSDRHSARVLSYGGYFILIFNLAALAANPFNKCFFYFDAQGAYQTGYLRDPAFYLLIAYNVFSAVYVFARGHGSQDELLRRRSNIVVLFSVMMAAALVLQILWPLTPFTALGCLVGNCFLHVYVIADEQTTRHMAELEKALARAHAAEKSAKESLETIERQRLEEAKLRKQLEEALQMAQAANKAKTSFLSNMSHDIRTPMNAIIGFTGLAVSHLDDQERVRDYLSTIMRSSEHLLSLINDVLDMSRIESGKMILHEKVESLSAILHVLQDIVQADIQAKQHTFYIDTMDVRNELVYCDKLRLNQVLLNLLSNAIKYTRPGGTISLQIVQKPQKKEGFASFEFRCKDNGIGMNEEFLRTIFDPFTREENTTVSGIQGTGLGMAITSKIVKMMGGELSVFSKKGEGSEFIVSLDFRIAGKMAADPTIPELKGMRGLVVDDDINACQSIADMLWDVGMHCEWCVSGREAVVRTEQSLRRGDCFKLFVVDCQMPDMNGIETVRRIRRLVGKEPFVIMLTAYDWADIENDARDAGATGVITKPLFPSDLQRELQRCCGRETPDQADKEEEVVSLKGKRVLMVDDNELNLKIGVLQLKQHGMIVDSALNGRLAIDMIRANGIDAYDFVLMDIQMPGMNGYETTSIIRKLPGGDKLKIIAFSANAFEEDREKSLNAGMNGHIAKPLKVEELMEEIRQLVE